MHAPRSRSATSLIRPIEGVAIVFIAALLSVSVLALVAGPDPVSRSPRRATSAVAVRPAPAGQVKTHAATATSPPPHRVVAPRALGVGRIVLPVVDTTRTMQTTSGIAVSRRFDVIVRYPIVPSEGPGSAAAGSSPGPFPLIVFGHGFAVTPEPYSLLLDAWTKAGYVVAAPVFPLENANAPGGPNEKDLVNQPRDMSVVISRMLSASDSGPPELAHLVDPRRVAVAGQSDGGDTALGVAYDPTARDPRIGAAVILSGAEDPFASPFSAAGGPPLLAIQGTADTINPPGDTYTFYSEASPPKFLLKLLGAGHQPPYTELGPDLTAVERASIAFLGCYLKSKTAGFQRLLTAGTAGGSSVLTGDPGAQPCS
jgi:fermentation-respiration switch protein FrsA (DUF1100 family)